MTLATVSAMRSSRDFYNFDKALVSPGADGKLKLHNADSLFHALGGITQVWYEKINPQTQEPVEFVIDPPLSVVKSVLAMDDSRDIPPLTAITTIPTLRVDGSLLNAAGYDEATGLLFIPRGEAPYINLSPENWTRRNVPSLTYGSHSGPSLLLMVLIAQLTWLDS